MRDSSVASTTADRALAVVFAGLLPRPDVRNRDDGCQRSLDALAERVLPALSQHVLQSPSSVGIYGHTWGCGRSAFAPQTPVPESLHRVLHKGLDSNLGRPVVRQIVVTGVPHPTTLNVSLPQATAEFYFFLSIKRALSLVVDEMRVPLQHFTLLLRWDCVFYSDFVASKLNPQLLYRSSWCRAIGPPMQAGSSCRSLRPFVLRALHCTDGEGVPDFWLAGMLSTLQHTLGDAAEFLISGRLRAKACPSVHGALAGLLERARATRGIRLGRYLVHQMDYDFIRTKQGRRFDDVNRSSIKQPLWAYAGPEAEQRSCESDQLESCCPERLFYCGCEASPLLPVACTRAS